MTLLATKLLPARLGLAWGMSKDEALAALKAASVRYAGAYLLLPLALDDATREVGLAFDADGLSRIELVVCAISLGDAETTDALEADLAQAHTIFEALVADHVEALGPPRYVGAFGDQNYPKDQTADFLAYWDIPQGRAVVDETSTDMIVFVRVMVQWFQ